MGTADKLPRFLVPYYKDLRHLIDTGQVKEAADYLFSLPPHIYDHIAERGDGKNPFAAVFNAIHKSKKSNYVKDYPHYEDDTNFLT